jgi:hypothetical protein
MIGQGPLMVNNTSNSEMMDLLVVNYSGDGANQPSNQ